MTTESKLREQFCRWGRSMFERGLTSGSSGNLSARLEDGFLVTPTNSCLGFLDPATLSKLDGNGAHVSGDKPTKEVLLHKAFYESRPQAMGIVHVHSTYATALSCLKDLDPKNVLPPMTPYVLMRVGVVPLLPYADPGNPEIVPFLRDVAPSYGAVLLANHGPVVSGTTFENAVFAAEEFEEAAKLYFLLKPYSAMIIPASRVTALTGKRNR